MSSAAIRGAAKAASVVRPIGRLTGRERDPARGGDPDAQSGEAAGSGGDGDTVERGEIEADALHHPRDQWQQRFGVAAQHGQRFARGLRRLPGVEHGGRAGLKRGIDGEDTHLSTVITREGG